MTVLRTEVTDVRGSGAATLGAFGRVRVKAGRTVGSAGQRSPHAQVTHSKARVKWPSGRGGSTGCHQRMPSALVDETELVPLGIGQHQMVRVPIPDRRAESDEPLGLRFPVRDGKVQVDPVLAAL